MAMIGIQPDQQIKTFLTKTNQHEHQSGHQLFGAEMIIKVISE